MRQETGHQDGDRPPSSVPSSAPASLDDNFRRGIRVVVAVAVAGIRMKMVGWMIVIMAWKADHVKWRRVESNQEWQ